MTKKLQKSAFFRSPLSTLLLRILGLLLLFSLSRVVFYLFNRSYFTQAGPCCFLAGIRFDVAMLFIINAPYILLMLLPFNFLNTRICRSIGNWYLGVVNSIALIINLIDTCYYPFSMRRLTADIFAFIGETNNFGTLIPVFLKDYYYMFFVLMVLIALLVLLLRFTDKIDYQPFARSAKAAAGQVFLRLLLAFGVLTGIRGGWQLRPLNIAMAAGDGVENAALVLNSPYSLIRTMGGKSKQPRNYFSDKECDSLFSPLNQDFSTDTLQLPETENVVIIILEGISSEYSDFLADEPKTAAGYTPFLDSLAKQSIVFRGFANGQHSIEAVSSILGGIPALLECPFVQSQYVANQIDYAIPELKKNGFSTSFYHGGLNGTMGFDRCCKVLGIENYYGKNEYTGSAEDFDGVWGIADVPYLQYFASELDKQKRPFFSTVFTLSSHNPFKVPEAYLSQVPKGDFPMQPCVAYTDIALREFFAKVSESEWYDKTLFVIVADHTTFDGAPNVDYQKHRYAIPMIFFHPQNRNAFRSDRIMQQADVMPSVFAFCGLQGSFISFGHNIFDEQAPHFAINYLSGTYEFYFDHYLIEFDGEQTRKVWDLSLPSDQRAIDKSAVPDFDFYEKTMKAVIQRFDNGLIRNELR